MANFKVYDLVYPSPIPLKDLSSIAVAIQLWRLDHNRNRMKNSAKELFDLGYNPNPEPSITLRNVIPHIPSLIDDIISKYLREIALSMKYWLQYHFDNVFLVDRIRDRFLHILNDFDDIVCDYDGSIDYVRTAARMILFDRFSPVEKFKIACSYSFEDSITIIWPTVERNFSLNKINFENHPLLYYWVCRLRNEMDRIFNYSDRISNYGEATVDDVMLERCEIEIRSSFDYFWNRASLQRRFEVAKQLSLRNKISFCGRFVLSKLNEQQLAEFVRERAADLLSYAPTNMEGKNYVFPIWMYIKDIIDEEKFITVVGKILDDETNHYIVDGPLVKKTAIDEKYYSDDNLMTCCKIWVDAPDQFKRSAIETLLPKGCLFKKSQLIPSKPRRIQFIGTVLSVATSQERKTFWLRNWISFLTSTRASDFFQIMELCLENGDEISLFKSKTLTKYENLSETVTAYLRNGFFQELADLLNVCWPDSQTCRGIKRSSLQSNFLGEHSVLSHFNINEPKSFREFVDDAYADDPKSGDDFRTQLLSRPETADLLVIYIKQVQFLSVMEFVESMDRNAEQLKKRFVDEVIPLSFQSSGCWFSIAHFQDFLVWCLGNEERVNEFKKTISPDEFLCYLVRSENFLSDAVDVGSGDIISLRVPRDLGAFMAWYFNSEEERSEFRARMDNVFKKLTDRPIFRFSDRVLRL